MTRNTKQAFAGTTPALGIDWPVNSPQRRLILSEKDRIAPLLEDSPVYFRYQPDSGPFNVECIMHPEKKV